MAVKVVMNKDHIRQDGTSVLYLQHYIGGRRIRINIDVSVLPDLWDDKRERVKGRSNKVKDQNLLIAKKKALASEILIKYRLRNENITGDLFRAEFTNPSLSSSFYEWMQKELNTSVNAPGTVAHERVVLKLLIAWRKTLYFSEIDNKLIDDLIKHFTRKYKNLATRYSKLKTVKKFVTLAKRRRLIKNNPFDNVKLKRDKPNPDYLEDFELISIINYYKSMPKGAANRKVARHFLFMCFTGLRISDFKSLKESHILGDFIILIPQKTKAVKGEAIKVPISKSAKKLLTEEKKCNPNAIQIFDTISDQVFNRFLKDIARACEIKKPLSSKYARHTFATTYLRHNKGDVVTLQKILGHSRIEETLVYVHINDAWKKEQMKVFDNYL